MDAFLSKPDRLKLDGGNLFVVFAISLAGLTRIETMSW